MSFVVFPLSPRSHRFGACCADLEVPWQRSYPAHCSQHTHSAVPVTRGMESRSQAGRSEGSRESRVRKYPRNVKLFLELLRLRTSLTALAPFHPPHTPRCASSFFPLAFRRSKSPFTRLSCGALYTSQACACDNGSRLFVYHLLFLPPDMPRDTAGRRLNPHPGRPELAVRIFLIS